MSSTHLKIMITRLLWTSMLMYTSPSYMEALYLYLSKVRADIIEISYAPQVLRFAIPIFEPHLKIEYP
ncbi:unnamed protein product [Allacma fusca]|uniref:Secreted protein n=1 Tax=Allacma fusca TaxID=39272 RepID=A0A8J2J0D7_9HEXA|nr:unnamed protein product [Allacma fusca]